MSFYSGMREKNLKLILLQHGDIITNVPMKQRMNHFICTSFNYENGRKIIPDGARSSKRMNCWGNCKSQQYFIFKAMSPAPSWQPIGWYCEVCGRPYRFIINFDGSLIRNYKIIGEFISYVPRTEKRDYYNNTKYYAFREDPVPGRGRYRKSCNRRGFSHKGLRFSSWKYWKDIQEYSYDQDLNLSDIFDDVPQIVFKDTKARNKFTNDLKWDRNWSKYEHGWKRSKKKAQWDKK